MKDKRKLVRIKWVDSSLPRLNNWIDFDTYEKNNVLKCETVGFIIYEDKKQVTIANTITDYQCLGELIIPKCSISSMRKIEGSE